MPLRVDSAEVRAILHNKDVPQNLTPFITIANTVTNRISGLPDAQLKEIERWLAAHFTSLMAPALGGKNLGNTTIYYARGTLGKYLDYTPYGQTVKLLDTTGTLSKVEIDIDTKEASIQVYG